MKKFSSIGSAALFSAMVALLFIACQKEQVATDSVTLGSEATVLNGVTGSGPFAGSITGAYAASLAYNFANKYKGGNQTIKVAFSAKDLSAFIASLKGKYNSDIIFVNFVLYGQGAEPFNLKDNGRMTVFFTGNNMPTATGNVRTHGTADDAYMNHGEIFP